MITIRIDGLRGEGKTATAIAIGQLLRGAGQQVEYVGNSEDQTRLISEEIEGEECPPFDEVRSFKIVDSH